MPTSRKPLTDRELDRLAIVIMRDFQTEPQPQYPHKTLEGMAPELRAQYDAMDAELQEIVSLTLDLLNQVKPRDRKLVLRALDGAATALRAQREADAFDPWDDILSA